MIKSTISAAALVVVGLLLPSAYAQACTTTITPALGIKPSIASGYAYAVVATGLTSPRGIEFDSQGKLLVVEEGLGVTLKTIGSTGTGATCASFSASKTLITDGSVSFQPTEVQVYAE